MSAGTRRAAIAAGDGEDHAVAVGRARSNLLSKSELGDALSARMSSAFRPGPEADFGALDAQARERRLDEGLRKADPRQRAGGMRRRRARASRRGCARRARPRPARRAVFKRGDGERLPQAAEQALPRIEHSGDGRRGVRPPQRQRGEIIDAPGYPAPVFAQSKSTRAERRRLGRTVQRSFGRSVDERERQPPADPRGCPARRSVRDSPARAVAGQAARWLPLSIRQPSSVSK